MASPRLSFPALFSSCAFLFTHTVPQARTLCDWAVISLFLILSGLLELLSGYRQPFRLDDPDISFPRAKTERTSVPLLLVLVIAVPVGVLLLAPRLLITQEEQYALLPSESGAAAGLPAPATSHSGETTVMVNAVISTALRAFAMAHSVTQLVTTVIKNSVGRPRPDLLDRCQPTFPSKSSSLSSGQVTGPDGLRNGLVTDTICTAPLGSHILTDGFRSFPSGHAGTSFTGMIFLALFLDALLAHGVRRAAPSIRAWRVLAATLCCTLALYISISRIEDHRHHPTDVLAGIFVGVLVALLIYALYSPPLPVAPLMQWLGKPNTTPEIESGAQADTPFSPARNGSPNGNGLSRLPDEQQN